MHVMEEQTVSHIFTVFISKYSARLYLRFFTIVDICVKGARQLCSICGWHSDAALESFYSFLKDSGGIDKMLNKEYFWIQCLSKVIIFVSLRQVLLLTCWL